MVPSYLVGKGLEAVSQTQRRVTRSLRVILVGDWCAEERHDSVAGVLVDRALEAVNALGQNLEEAVEDGMPLFGARLLRELHRTLDVGEHDRHLFSLAFER